MDEELVRIICKTTVNANGCWIWQAGGNGKGYSQCQFRGEKMSAHRAIYTGLVGSLEKGKHLHHCCPGGANILCCNPNHLHPVTPKEHLELGPNAPRTHCKNGHLLDEANKAKGKNGGWICRACRDASSKRYLDRKRTENPPRPIGRPRGTHCLHGHPYDETNTRYDKKGYIYCQPCYENRILNKAARRRLKATEPPTAPQSALMD